MNISFAHRRWGLSLLSVAAFGMAMAAVGQTQSSTHARKTAASAKALKSGRVVLYASLGTELTPYDVDVDGATLTKRSSVTLPENVQAAWPHPSRKYLYVAWSNRGSRVPNGTENGLSAFRIDPASGALLPNGPAVSLAARPIYVTTDIPGTHVLVAYSDPSGLTVHRIEQDGAIGSQVEQPAPLDVGVYGHQVRVEPSNETVILTSRGNPPAAGKPEDPGAVKIFTYKDGLLTNRLSIAPGGGLNFQARHVDFHPFRPWVFLSLEEQSKLQVYRMLKDGSLSSNPLFVKDTLTDPGNVRPGRSLGAVHIHPNGKFVYVVNRANGTTDFDGKSVFAGGENSIAVFAINQETGEPTLVQNIDTRGINVGEFALDPSGRILVVGNMVQLLRRDGKDVSTIPASLAVFRVRNDGKLDYVRKYDADAGNRLLFWIGMTSLP